MVARAARTPAAPVDQWRVYDQLDLPPILAAALDAFYENGYHGTTVRDIAARVGVTVPALYYHYENKQAILSALLQDAVDDSWRRIQLAVRDAGDQPVAQLTNLVECIALRMTCRSRLAGIGPERRHMTRSDLRRYLRVRTKSEDLLVSVLRDGSAAGVFRVADPEETGRAIFGMVRSIARWYEDDPAKSPDRLAREYADLALRLAGATPA